MHVTVQPWGKKFQPIFWQEVVNPVLEEAVALKDCLNLTTETNSSLETVTGRNQLKCHHWKIDQATRSEHRFSPDGQADELRRNLVQPIVLGTGGKIKKVSVREEESQGQSADFDLVRWFRRVCPICVRAGPRQCWTFCEVAGHWSLSKGGGSKVVKQSEKTNTSLKNLKKITITMGD